MKVLHVINTLSAGGAELHLLTLCRHLRRQGIEVIVACLREKVKDSRPLHSDFEQEAIKVVNLQGDSRYDGRFLLRLARLLKEEQPNILHTHLPRADFAGMIGHLIYSNSPWVCSVHDIYSKSWSGKWTLSLFNLIWRRADVLIAISHAVKDWLVQQRNIPAKQVTVIHYGIESGRFIQSGSDLRKIWDLNGQLVIGSIGRLEPRKGHEYLIRAMPAILKHVPNASLIIAGHDPWGYGQKLRTIINELGLNSKVRLVGFQSDIPSFLHALDVFAFASQSEGFGQVVIEAMAVGKPLVASGIPPLTEIVEDRKTGLLAERNNPQAFAHAISWLLMHPEEARQMGRRGQEQVCKHFSAEKMSAKTISLYNELIRAAS